jgi:geranylgeranyl pyrophosphate synthase
MELTQIYLPIEKELKKVEEVLESCLKESKNKSILEISNYLLNARGKRLRPALVLLSAKAVHQSSTSDNQLINVAIAVELIHMASLLHDDVIDHASLRHNKPTINCRWDNDVSIALGDYLYSVAFELISTCGNTDILQCISSATKAMCEGELLQVCERDNLELLKERYIVIVKKKTAALFAASCQAGALISTPYEASQKSLREYGLNFGISFQIIDDCLDLVGREEILGKTTGADLRVGEITLPVLYLLDKTDIKEAEVIKRLLSLCGQDKDAFNKLRKRLANSSAILKAEAEARYYIGKAKEQLKGLDDSLLKRSLLNLADYIVSR